MNNTTQTQELISELEKAKSALIIRKSDLSDQKVEKIVNTIQQAIHKIEEQSQ